MTSELQIRNTSTPQVTYECSVNLKDNVQNLIQKLEKDFPIPYKNIKLILRGRVLNESEVFEDILEDPKTKETVLITGITTKQNPLDNLPDDVKEKVLQRLLQRQQQQQQQNQAPIQQEALNNQNQRFDLNEFLWNTTKALGRLAFLSFIFTSSHGVKKWAILFILLTIFYIFFQLYSFDEVPENQNPIPQNTNNNPEAPIQRNLIQNIFYIIYLFFISLSPSYRVQ